MIGIQEVESERGLRTLVGGGVPAESQKLPVLRDVESVLIATPTEREVNLVYTRKVDGSEHSLHFDWVGARRPTMPELDPKTNLAKGGSLEKSTGPTLYTC